MNHDEAVQLMTAEKYLRNELVRIWEQTGKTIVFVTHDLEEALYLADSVVVFSTKPTRIERIITLDRPRPRNLSVMSNLPTTRLLVRQSKSNHRPTLPTPRFAFQNPTIRHAAGIR